MMKLDISRFPQKHDMNLLIKTHSQPPPDPLRLSLAAHISIDRAHENEQN